MNQGQAGWLILLLFALIMIVVGAQGNLGTLIAILFCPQYVDITQE